MRLVPVALALVCLLGSAPSRPTPEPLAAWIGALQVGEGPAAGAILLHPDPAFWLDGVGYRHVVPYFSTLAVTAWLDAAPSAEALAAAEGWMAWSLANRGAHGVPAEVWVGTDGAVTTCPARLPTRPAVDRCDHVDATDSAAATLLDLARAYAEAGGDGRRLEAWRDGLRQQGAVLAALQDADGLTWARGDYRVKFLMDNAETVRGFRALADLERRWGAAAAARGAEASADRAAAGLAGLRDARTGLYAWARHADGRDDSPRLDRWYADAVAQVWPLLFGAAPADHARGGYRALDAAYDGTTRPDWTAGVDASGFEWPAVGLAAALAGDRTRARAHVEAVWRRRVRPDAGRPFAGPFTVADAGWLLRAVVATG